jgi:tetratricopeptide (TPR) repeat protein
LILLVGTFLASVVVWQTGLVLQDRFLAGRHEAIALAASAPKTVKIDPAALRGQIVHDGEIDQNALDGIEKGGNDLLSAAAYFQASQFEYERKNYEPSLRYIRRALEFAPEQPALRQFYAVVLVDSGQYADAVVEGERAALGAPGNADVQRTLGLAYYKAGRLPEAIATWERSQELEPNDAIAQYLAKAKRETAVEGSFSEIAKGHFILRYEGGKPAEALTSDLLRILEVQYDDLTRDLGTVPPPTVTVTLYSRQQFFDVTQAPSWVGALNDGQMRIPLGDVSSVSPQLETVLRHELTHSFVHAAVRNCPVWLNEGLAQMEEPKTASSFPASIRERLGSSDALPLHELEGEFTGLSSAQAKVAYLKSLAATEYLREAYGQAGLHRMLTLLAEGKQTEAALKEVTDSGYDGLEQQVQEYLARWDPKAAPHSK